MELLRSMAVPFLACLVLTGIHVYLGIHVIARKVIFVDLALATIAALGAVWGMLLGWDAHGDAWVIKGFSLVFTIVGAALFSLTRMRHERVPQEAIIGITYAVALAAIVLGSAKLPHGAEEVRDLQAGSILWVGGGTVAFTAALYAAIGAFHFVFRERFLAISRDPEAAEAAGIRVRLWDFLFYVSFGFVVTSSVSIAGVLLVFSYLVVPAAVAVLFADGIGARLTIGWIVGTVISALGVAISYFRDLPSGPVIVVGFGAFLVLAGVAHHLLNAQSKLRAGLRVAGVAAAFAALLGSSLLLRKPAEVDLARILRAGVKSERIVALNRVAEEPERWSEIADLVPDLLREGDVEVRLAALELAVRLHRSEVAGQVRELLSDPDDVVREEAVEALRVLGARESAGALLAAAADEEDDYIRTAMGEAALVLGDVRGIDVLLDVMATGDARQARRDAFERFRARLHPKLPFDAEASASDRERAVAALRAWWHDAAPPLDPSAGG